MSEKRKCPCCGYLTFGETTGEYDICPVCFWEDDPIQGLYPDMAGGANAVSLQTARKNYQTYKVSEERFRNFVREPKKEEMPNETIRENL